MTLTEHQKNELNAVAEGIVHYIEDHLRETVSWQMPDKLVDNMNDSQFVEAMDYAYNEVLAGLTEK